MSFLDGRIEVGVFIGIMSWALAFAVRALALKCGAVALSDARRRNGDRAIPLWGGLAIFLPLLLLTRHVFEGSWAGSPFTWAITVVFLTGFLDDRFEFRARYKLAGQVVAAGILAFSGSYSFHLVEGYTLAPWVCSLLVMAWLVGMSNAMNLIDGLDGLCAGVASIAAFTLGFMLPAENPFAMIAFGLGGACVGFLVHNFQPARIFLGDCGSMLLGFTLAAISIELNFKRSLFISFSVPMLLLAVPVLDTVLTIVRRARRDRSLFQGDRGHLHHRLLKIGLSVPEAVLFLWATAAYLGLHAFVLSVIPPAFHVYLYFMVLPNIVCWVATLRFIERRLSGQAEQHSHRLMTKGADYCSTQRDLITHIEGLGERYENEGKGYSVIVIETWLLIGELPLRKIDQIVDFQVSLYELIERRRRKGDFVFRCPGKFIALFFPGATDVEGEHRALFDYYRSELRNLEQKHQIVQVSPDHPEGMQVLVYPQDKNAIARLGELSSANPDAQAA